MTADHGGGLTSSFYLFVFPDDDLVENIVFALSELSFDFISFNLSRSLS